MEKQNINQFKAKNISQKMIAQDDVIIKLCDAVAMSCPNDQNKEIICDLLFNRIMWQLQRAKRYKACFHIFTLATAILPLLSVVIQCLKGINGALDWFSICVNSIISISSILLGHFRFLDRWTDARNAVEKAIRKINLYMIKPPKDVPSPVDFYRLMKDLESVFDDERAKWLRGQCIHRHKNENSASPNTNR